MADTKISALTESTAPLDASEVAMIVSAASRRVTRDNFLDGVTIQMEVDAKAMTPAITAGAEPVAQREIGANNVNVDYIAFPDGTDSEVQFTVKFPENWNAGTVTMIGYWTTELPSASAETWQIECSGVGHKNDDAIGGTAFGTLQNMADTFLAVGDWGITAATSAITIASSGTLNSDDAVTFKLKRDVDDTDTLAGSVQLIKVVIEYTITKTAATG